MLLPSIFGENLLDDWMDFPRFEVPDIDKKLYGKHAAGLMKTDSEQSLYNACDRYIDRFRKYENTATDMGLNIQDSDTCITNQLWKDISKKEKLEEN